MVGAQCEEAVTSRMRNLSFKGIRPAPGNSELYNNDAT